MKLTAALLLACALPCMLSAQKRMCSYPFEFEKSFLQRSDYDAYFLDNQKQESFALILKDNKKADYALLNKQFKLVSKVATDIKTTIFSDDDYSYAGGTASGNEFHFVYSGKEGYQMETVNFDTKAVGHRKIFALTKQEKTLTSFNSENRFFALTTNDKTNELTLYKVGENGELSTRVIPFTIPAEVEKQRNKLSTYLSRLRVMKSEEEPDFSNAVVDAKLFTYPDHFDFVINDKDNPTHIVSVQLPGLQAQEKFFSYDGIVPAGEKGNVYVSSFEKNGKIFSLLLNKKNIRLAVHELQSGNLLNKYEINEDKGSEMFVQAPVTERRYGKREDAKDVEDVKKLIKMLTRGTEGVMVTENKNGQLVITIGTYDLIPISGGSTGGGWVGGWQTTTTPASNGGVRAVQTWNPNMYYRPGTPSYTTTSARYYTTTYFKILLDPATLKTTRGRLPRPVAEQVKDYLETVDRKVKATNQFCIGKEQFYGYYDSDAKAYVIDQIKIFQ